MRLRVSSVLARASSRSCSAIRSATERPSAMTRTAVCATLSALRARRRRPSAGPRGISLSVLVRDELLEVATLDLAVARLFVEELGEALSVHGSAPSSGPSPPQAGGAGARSGRLPPRQAARCRRMRFPRPNSANTGSNPVCASSYYLAGLRRRREVMLRPRRARRNAWKRRRSEAIVRCRRERGAVT